jgi:hypothetical protein
MDLQSGNWGGFQPWFVILFFMVCSLVLFYYWSRNRKKIKQHNLSDSVLVDFYLENGQCKHVWCTLDQGTGEILLNDEDRKKLEKIAEKFGGYKGDMTKLLSIKAPSGYPFDKYYTNTEFIFDDWYPFDKPPAQQIKIKTCAFYAGIPLPCIGLTLAKWDSKMLQELASRIIGLADDSNTLKSINAQDNSFWNNLSTAVKMLSQLPTLKWVGFAAAGAAIVAAVICFVIMTKINVIYQIFVPGG